LKEAFNLFFSILQMITSQIIYQFPEENENALSDDYISVELIEMQGKSKL
jgi:hypothetical protein